ncbi:MAG: class I SAM-dependent methyltransferase [Candidatus Eisenbacteria bacterium]|nr:class I SAM-dependent methyltransferase [Candidatus Eisenbacteria bacterium]MCC7143310.1 class I SAM-dependent methyltransferase [Candidatus Eisenbacteria bacterium]
MDIRESYDSAAEGYAEHLSDELRGKPLDRHLLNRFAEETRDCGLVADIGCGPGHVARYLKEQGVAVYGVDLSEKMVQVARDRHAEIAFRVEDMGSLSATDRSLAGAVLFYSIVHFAPDELLAVFREVRRVLVEGGLALIAFHRGDGIVHTDELFGAPVSLDFRYHSSEGVIDALTQSGFTVIEQIHREPYEGAEYPSRRCYLLARAA